jgi:flagellar L-ring protein precursor FlgH
MKNSFAFTIALSLGGIQALCADPTPPAVGSTWGHSGAATTYSSAAVTSMFGDPVAHSVGDLVTIVVDLQNQITKDQNTTTAKTTAVDAAIQSLLYPPDASNHGFSWYGYHGQNPSIAWNSANSFNGGGTIANAETASTTIQARVTAVGPNGVLRVEATRFSKAGEEDTSMILSGLVRPEDLSQANSISSSRIADLQILQKGKGTITENQRKGWLTKLYEFLQPF